jgi:hypothetical protein
VRQYRFQALVTLSPGARKDPAGWPPSRSYALTVHACFLVQLTNRRECFPAGIFWDEEPPGPSVRRATMTIALADGEAEAFFAPGRRLTIWADGTVGRTIRPEGLVGHCVICGQKSLPPADLADDRVRRATAGPDPGNRLAVAGPLRMRGAVHSCPGQ